MNAKNIKMFTLPNFVTLANLALGCAAIVVALGAGHRLDIAFWLIAAAAVCDFLDGTVARLTGQYSALGVQLDSLADMVSFGVAPSVVLFELYKNSASLWGIGDCFGWGVFVVALFSALRLAKFNIDDTQTTEFVGLPVPANALLIAGLGWVGYSQGGLDVPREAWLGLAVVMSYLLISPIRMFSLKFKGLGRRDNGLQYRFLVCCAVLVAVLGIGGVSASIGVYIATSTVRHFIGNSKNSAV
ncbi:MAG: CDP-diacylglycerol--serine O-phosphatidyltransferase [Rikenellaceae bacterium]|jgi:CDP-diacylglycerol--serine O-phosphatidyltransferase|nr:CDP-diacylglycerol--serine O-phosphatidyltransferase [Rikenellaceae bacterium]